MGMGGETGLFDFSFEQPEEKIAKNSNPKIPPPSGSRESQAALSSTLRDEP